MLESFVMESKVRMESLNLFTPLLWGEVIIFKQEIISSIFNNQNSL